MVEERVEDGTRIAQLLASELDGREDGRFAALALAEADPEVEPTTDGAFAYAVDVEREDDAERLADVYVHPDRVRLEFVAGVERAAERASEAGLRVRPKATEPPRTLAFVESGAAVKRAADVVEALADEA
jgi:hypothetical protein